MRSITDPLRSITGQYRTVLGQFMSREIGGIYTELLVSKTKAVALPASTSTRTHYKTSLLENGLFTTEFG